MTVENIEQQTDFASDSDNKANNHSENGGFDLSALKVVDITRNPKLDFDVKTSPFNREAADHGVRDLIVRGLLAIFAFFFCSLIIYVLFGSIFHKSIEQSEKVISVIEHFLAIITTLFSGVLGYYFGKNNN